MLAGAASAAVPAFPNNVVVFPDRDFVSIEGYSEQAGETAVVEVTRPGVGVVGSAQGVVSGTDVAFEINHPGGVCWGNGTALQVTPDIIAGDVVSVTFPDGSHDETTTSSATVTHDMVKSGTTVTVEGTFDPTTVNPDFLEQRIINADLVPIVGKRDVRALPGPIVPAPRGGYSSGMSFPTPGHFVATYQFDTQEAADAAAAADLGERAMNWQVQDPDGNRQGLTIAEFGEVGGPGVGGCPAGPADQSAPAGTASVVRTGATALLKWTSVTAVPTADPVTGYSVEAIGAPSGSGQQTSTGLRVGVNATQATLSGLDPAASYAFEVRSMAGAKLSIPFKMGAVDTTAPTLALSPQPVDGTVVETNAVTVSSNGQVFFTTDGSPVISGDLPSDNATLLVGNSIPITAPVTLKVVAFDQVGNASPISEGDFTPSTVGLPAAAPTGLAGTAGETSIALTWDALVDPTVTGYQVSVYNGAGIKLATQPPVTSVPRQTVTGLTPGTTYQFSVAAKNPAGTGPDSSPLLTKATTPAQDHISITSAKWKAADFRVVGTGDKLGAIIQLYRVNADGTAGAAIAGATAQVVAAAPPGIGDWTIRLRNAAAGTTNPGRIIAKSDGGAIAGPFTVSNG
jgi:hypothetical protein